ncbi:hypothetical protein K8S17_00105 [bacterium]|nr:hypothetical protein [bacterium]
MRHLNARRPLFACFVLLLVCLTTAGSAHASESTDPVLPGDVEAHGLLTLGALGGNIYVQTSAEYRACCYGIYACASLRLEEMLEEADPRPAGPAVVMDLDETVIHNGSFQTFLYENGLEYTPELWDEFERRCVAEVRLVPGAREFIERTEALGVTVLYLSNRNERNRVWTASALEVVGINVDELTERLYLKPSGASSNKSAHRDAIAARYNVLMLFGDNLRDFSDVFKAAKPAENATTGDYLDAIAARTLAVDEAACHWGIDWFVLPNPVYGEWQKLISPVPASTLQPSDMKAR